MSADRQVSLVSVATTTITDQAGLPQLALIGLDANGFVWKKLGDNEWQLIDAPVRPLFRDDVASEASHTEPLTQAEKERHAY